MPTEPAAEGTADHKVDVSTIPLQLPVAQAWARVMGDVRQIALGDKTTGGSKYEYRGVNRVMNEVGPALRKHGVAVIPRTVSVQHRDIPTAKGGTQHEVMVEMAYTIVGPMGDPIEGGAFGESADSSDKATAQAQSVAYRTFLLQSLCIPTGDPEPDENHIERGKASAPAVSDADRAAAVAAGWASMEQRDDAWLKLYNATTALTEKWKDDVVKWFRHEGLEPTTFTIAQAATWQEVLDAARQTEKDEIEEATGKVQDAFPGAHVEQDHADDGMDDPF